LLNLTTFIGKCSALVLVMIWMRWSLPRLRIDQVMMTCLKYFLPISCVLLVGVCLWQLVVPAVVARVVTYALAFGCGGLALVVFASLFRSSGTAFAPAGQLPGAWDGQPKLPAAVSK
jgi:NADH-quinone oxidoreductase subunit H